MKLADFLAAKNISVPEFGRRIRVSAETVRRYCDGERIPHQRIMPLIFDATGGAVSADDFFGLPKADGFAPHNGEAA